MSGLYNDQRTISPYLSTDPHDAGLRYRHSGDLLLIYGTARAIDCPRKRTKERSAITRFSKGAANRMGRYLRECDADYKYMHTLTYPSEYPSDGKLVKYQLRRYLQTITRLAERNGRKAECSFFWFIEFQARGAPHFHIFTTEFVDYKYCAKLWYEIVQSGDIRHLKAGIRVESIKKGRKGLICYAKKYARKQEQKEVPVLYQNVGKFWGIHGLKTRKAADVVFFNDMLHKHDILKLKDGINTLISLCIDNNGIKLLKRDFNFRMFHIDINNPFALMLISEIKRCSNEMQTMQEINHDCEFSSGYSDIIAYDFYSGNSYRGSDIYLNYKQGNCSCPIPYRPR